MNNLTEIVDKFRIDGIVSSIDPLGSGLINDTYKITTQSPDTDDYVLQRINHAIFKDVDLLQKNIVAITDHIRKKLTEKGETDIKRKALQVIPTKDGKLYYFDGQNYWRVTVLIPQSKTYETVNPEFSYYTGKAFGEFQAMLVDLPEPLGETIPKFHNMEFRLESFKEAIASNKSGRLEKVQWMVDELMKRSYEILKDHPLNVERKKKGLNPANCCWFWGAGTRPSLAPFEEKYGKKGMMISAVDLLKGIAVGAKMGVAHVEGANGGLNTNYEGKTQAAIDALHDGYDFAYIHVEAPDEMGHQGSVERKVKAIEYLDQRVIGPLTQELDKEGVDYRLLVMPDHPTPIRLRTHTADSVPYLLFDSTKKEDHTWNYNEEEAAQSGNFVAYGHEMMKKLLEQ